MHTAFAARHHALRQVTSLKRVVFVPNEQPLWLFILSERNRSTHMQDRTRRPLLIGGIWLGLGLGGFFDGVVFHQILQWHHMLTSAGYPATSVANLNLNTLADGLFHAATYLFTLIGLTVLWRASTRNDIIWSARILLGAILLGWGLFNLVEGLIDHQLLGLHHVRDDLPPGPATLGWDLGFLAWGVLMLASGWWLTRGDDARALAESSPGAGSARTG
jgi:uncharacterized membrane protein